MAKLSNDIEEFLGKESTQNFLQAARQFVDLLETEEISFQAFISKAHISLIELYVAGHRLEQIPLKYSGKYSEFEELKSISFKSHYQELISELDNAGFYWEVFDPTYSKEGTEPVQGWLVDDFSDIYRDLKTELEKIKLNTDEAIEDALWQLKFSFRHHWGNHCIDAMRALQYLWYDGKL